MAEAVLRAGHRVRFATPVEIADELIAARSESELARVYRELDICDLLVLYDLGREPLSAGGARELVELFAQRDGRRSTLVTTEIAVRDWERIFGDTASTQAVRRSLVERSVLLE